MVNIQIDIDEGQNKIVNMCKLVNSLESKQTAVSKIIIDWGNLQSLSYNEIEKRIIDYFKKRWSERKTHDKRNWIKGSEELLKKAYKEYSKNINNFSDMMIKKYKVNKKFMEEFMEEENWTNDEYEMEKTTKKDKKIKVKIFDKFQDLISDWQEEIGKKYDCKIEHEEFFWSAKTKYGPLKIECMSKEIHYYLEPYIKEVIKEMIKILRGSKCLRDVMDENKSYLERIEKKTIEKQ